MLGLALATVVICPRRNDPVSVVYGAGGITLCDRDNLEMNPPAFRASSRTTLNETISLGGFQN